MVEKQNSITMATITIIINSTTASEMLLWQQLLLLILLLKCLTCDTIIINYSESLKNFSYVDGYPCNSFIFLGIVKCTMHICKLLIPYKVTDKNFQIRKPITSLLGRS